MIMYLREKLDEKELIKTKIEELNIHVLHTSNIVNDEVVSHLLSCIDDLQNINLILDKVNQQTKLLVGKTEITISTAVEIRNAIKSKIDVITKLITKDENKLDILNLIKQRDGIIEEYNSINNAIRLIDWSVKLD